MRKHEHQGKPVGLPPINPPLIPNSLSFREEIRTAKMPFSITIHSRSKSQSGVVLLISLIMLLLLTLIGSTGMQSATLEERMAGNMRDKNLAFQAAESALSAAENSLNPPNPLPTFTAAGNGGFYAAGVVAPKVMDDATWSGNKVAQSSLTTNEMGNKIMPPQYIIQELGKVDCPGFAVGSLTCNNYRINVRATGGSTDAVVILESYYLR